jgi:hypothetical protein
MGAVVLALGYAWARVSRADWWKAATGAVAASVVAVTVQQVVVAGSIAGGGRSFGQVRHYSPSSPTSSRAESERDRGVTCSSAG